MFGDLPEGVYQEGNTYFHKSKRLVRSTTIPGAFEYEMVPTECSFSRDVDEELITQARERAAAKGIDFYDHRIVEGQVVGWLHKGRKRSLEWPANLGSGALRYERIPVPDSENPDLANQIDIANEPEPVSAGGKADTKHG